MGHVAGADWTPIDQDLGDMGSRVSWCAEHRPDLLALVTGDGEEVTYRELLDRAAALAPGLATAAGTAGGVTVMARYDGFGPVAALAATIAGLRIALIDATEVPDRLDALVGVLRLPVVARSLDASALAALDTDLERHVVDEPPDPPRADAVSGEPDVVATTSGSTSAPKAAVLPAERWYYADNEATRIARKCRLQVAGVGTYGYLNGVLSSMYRGGTNAMFDARNESLADLLEFVVERKVTSLSSTSTMMQAIARLRGGRALDSDILFVMMRGERVTGDDLAAIHAVTPMAWVRLQYASTEAAGIAFHNWFPGDPIPTGLVPLTELGPGCEIAFVRPDGSLEPTPSDGPAELAVVGPGHFTGYIGRSSDDVFLHEGGRKWVRTGDLAELDEHGHLRVLGRLGRRVKVAGQFVDLDDVATAFEAHPSVSQAAVTSFDDGGTVRLVGHLVPAAGVSIDPVAIRAEMAGRLPLYMVPSLVRVVDEPPVNISGKIDHLVLGAWRPAQTQVARTELARRPADPVEGYLLRTVGELLGRTLDVDDDLIDAGLDSLGWVELIERLRVQFDVVTEMATLFARPTVRGIADAVRAGAPTVDLVRLTSGNRQPALLWTLLGLAAQEAVPLAKAMPERTTLLPVPRGFGRDGPVALTVEQVIDDIVGALDGGIERQPLVVAGFSTGCHHTQSLAARLVDIGWPVELLVLLDPPTGRWTPLRPLRRLQSEQIAFRARRRLAAGGLDVESTHHLLFAAQRRETMRHELPSFAGPTLVVRTPRLAQRPLPAGLTGPTRVEVVPGGHFDVIADGARLAAIIEQALATPSAAGVAPVSDDSPR